MPTINQRAAIAEDVSSSEATLRALAEDSSVKVRTAVATNPSTPADVLAVLVDDPRQQVRWSVAENPSGAARAVALGASDDLVRLIATRRDDLTDDEVRALTSDPAAMVREGVARLCRDPQVLLGLTRDVDPSVRAACLENPLLPAEEAERLACDPIAQVRAVAAAVGLISSDSLIRLANDRSDRVRFGTENRMRPVSDE